MLLTSLFPPVPAPRRQRAAAHPPVAQMVRAALGVLTNKEGTSLSAIKKHISQVFNVDVTQLAPFLCRYLKKAVKSGQILQVKGVGGTGSFRLREEGEKIPKSKEQKQKKAANRAKRAALRRRLAKAKTGKKGVKGARGKKSTK